MPSFSTEFPIDPKNTVAGVLQLACKWITGSPHTKLSEDALQEIPNNGETAVIVEDEKVVLAHAIASDFEMGGAQYIRTENDLQWTSTMVTYKDHGKHLLSFHVVCEALNTAIRLPPPKKPYFIRQAITELGGGSDGEIPVADQPFLLSSDEVNIAKALINGAAHNTLPIVYVSSGFDGKYSVDPTALAKLISGMAHVVVEPDREFSFKLRNLTNARNSYGGAIGVYWPNTFSKSSYFINEEAPNSRSLQLSIARGIQFALSNRRQAAPCTWLNLRETLNRNRFENLRKQDSSSLDDWVKAFDDEVSAKTLQLTEAENEISRLREENNRLSRNSQTGGFLSQGKEQDFYQGEIRDIIIDILSDSIRNVQSNSRRLHILQDIVEANPPAGERRHFVDEIKRLFNDYRDMDQKTKNTLTRLGFSLSEDGKHYKAIFHDDSRYSFTIPKTSSDHRSGKNTASDINKKLF